MVGETKDMKVQMYPPGNPHWEVVLEVQGWVSGSGQILQSCVDSRYIQSQDFDPLDGSICCGTQLVSSWGCQCCQLLILSNYIQIYSRYFTIIYHKYLICLFYLFLSLVFGTFHTPKAYSPFGFVSCCSGLLPRSGVPWQRFDQHGHLGPGGMLSFRGRCFTYDKSADGYLRGEAVSLSPRWLQLFSWKHMDTGFISARLW